MPISVERATMQRPHAEYGYATHGDAHATPYEAEYTYPLKASTVAAFLTEMRNLPDFKLSRKSVE